MKKAGVGGIPEHSKRLAIKNTWSKSMSVNTGLYLWYVSQKALAFTIFMNNKLPDKCMCCGRE